MGAYPTLTGLDNYPMGASVGCLWSDWLSARCNVQIQDDMFFAVDVLCGACLYV